jgi:uncharacterized Tic20 family protein
MIEDPAPGVGWCRVIGSRSLSAMTDATPPPDDRGAGTPRAGTPPPDPETGNPQAGHQQPGHQQPQQPSGYQPPSGYANVDDRTWALIAHFGGAALALISLGPAAFIVPLIAYLATRRESAAAQAHAKAALNFQIPISIAGAILWVLHSGAGSLPFGAGVVIGGLLWLLQLAVAAIGTIFGVVAGIKASEGALYAYPLNFKIVK